jgi:RNA polymerase sigma factor (sigma-70 family)
MDPRHALDGARIGAPSAAEFTRTKDDVERFQRGDPTAFDAIWSRYRPALEVVFAARVRPRLARELRARIDAADVLQDAALKVHEKLQSFEYRGPGSVLAWMTEIVLHVATDKIDYWRAEIRDPRREIREGIDDGPKPLASIRDPARGPMTEANFVDVRRAIGEALAKLSERHQTMVIWKFFGGVTWAEIAQEVGGASEAALHMEFRGKVLPQLAALLSGRG